MFDLNRCRFFRLIFVVSVISVNCFSCQKQKSKSNDTAPPIPASAPSQAASSIFTVSVNGGTFAVVDSLRVRDITANSYSWYAGSLSSGWEIRIYFGGLLTSQTSFSIVHPQLQAGPGECQFLVSGEPPANGFAQSGLVTVSQGNPGIINFNNILVTSTHTNSPGTYTVSGNLQF